MKGLAFDDFLLDLEERVLYRDGQPVSLTPKAYQLLHTLIQRRGRIVEREELFRAVWGDTIVEEGNLAFTIRLLRKTLGDVRSTPRFIETVPRRGYRFVGEVREVPPLDASESATPSPASGTTAPGILRFRHIGFRWVVVVLFFVAAAALSMAWFVRKLPDFNNEAQKQLSVEHLSTDGRTTGVVISPDGKNIVYISSGVDGRQSVWLRQLETDNNVELIPPTNDYYYGLAFSPDANFLYFARRAKGYEGQADIFRMSIFGGIPKRIASETQGWISLSADGRSISFVRCPHTKTENCVLWIADTEREGHEKKLVTRSPPLRISASAISHDGESVAFAVGQSENASNDFELRAVDIKTGEERLLANDRFFNIKSVVWLSNGRGLLISARKTDDALFRVWLVAPDGVSRVLTRDATNYSSISIDRTGERIAVESSRPDFRLRVYEIKQHARGIELSDAHSASFAPDGRIVFSSSMTGNSEIWMTEVNTGARTQLTSEPSVELVPIVSPDNRMIYFSSNRTGRFEVFRMAFDGSNLTQLTLNQGGLPMAVSPDGGWVYYSAGEGRTLRRVAANGTGIEEEVIGLSKRFFALSPRGDQVAYPGGSERRNEIVVFSLTNNQVVRSFPTAVDGLKIMRAKWLPDGSAIVYVTVDSEEENNVVWLQNIDGSQPVTLVEIDYAELASFDVAPDGQTFLTASGGWKSDIFLVTGLL